MGAAVAAVAGYAALFAAQWMTHRREVTGMPFAAWTIRVALAGGAAAATSWWFA
jgi:hypothetical protein